ncbi:MAG TPA: glycosyltransferase family 87 protein [Vicinamibacterales bacterium]
MWTNPVIGRVVEWLVALAGLLVFAVGMLAEASRGPGYDLVPLVAAGRLVATGQASHLYGQDELQYNRSGDQVFDEAASGTGFRQAPTPFVYPPLVAIALAPISAYSFTAIHSAWSWISVGLYALGIWLTIRVYLQEWNGPIALGAALFVATFFEPVRYSFWLGQATALIFPLVIGAIALQRRGRDASAAALLAVAVFIKLTPAVLLASWIWRGPRRAVAWCVGWLTLLVTASVGIAGVELHREYINRIAAIGREVVVAYNNHTVLAWLSRPFFPRSEWFLFHTFVPPRAGTIGAILVLASLIAAAWLALHAIAPGRPGRWRPASEALACLTPLLAGSIAWTHYFVFTWPAIAVVLGEGGSLLRVVAIAAFLLVCRPMMMSQAGPDVAAGWLQIGLPTLVALILWLTVVAMCRRMSATPSA